MKSCDELKIELLHLLETYSNGVLPIEIFCDKFESIYCIEMYANDCLSKEEKTWFDEVLTIVARFSYEDLLIDGVRVYRTKQDVDEIVNAAIIALSPRTGD